MSELRYCFVAYEDNEQTEAGDTLTHTWDKPDWPYCTTKYFYLWGSVAGQTCVSTSPIFSYHNRVGAPITVYFEAKDDNRTLQWEVDWGIVTVMANYGAPTFNLFAGSYRAGGSQYVWRQFLNFDISSIPLGATIVSATLQPFVHAAENDQVARGIICQHGTQGIPVTTADWTHFDGNLFCRRQFPIPTGQYIDMDFNAEGLASLQAALGSTSYKLAARGGVDYDLAYPIGVYKNYIWYYSTQKGTGYRPRLAITYEPFLP